MQAIVHTNFSWLCKNNDEEDRRKAIHRCSSMNNRGAIDTKAEKKAITYDDV